MDGKVIQLDRKHQEETAQVMAAAFTTYPLMTYIFENSRATMEESLLTLFRVSCEIRYVFDWPLLGALDAEGKIVGAALLGLERDVEWPESLQQKHNAFKQIVGQESAARLEEYAHLADSSRPAAPHYHLGVIGVLPGMQGKGFGSKLLNKAHQMSENDPTSTGVWLDTESEQNVAYYQKFDYQVKAHSTLENIVIWGMFRPNP